MLQGIHRAGRSWAGRAVIAVMFGFLIISFAIWGIGDIFRGTVRTQVATVGKTDVTGEAFRTAYQNEYQSLLQRTRQSISPEQARALGLEQRVLGRLVSETALDQDARKLGLSVPDAVVVRSIQADPTFQGTNGAFDRARFTDLLRSNGLGEAQFVREQRSVVARQQIVEAVTGAVPVPLAMREAVHRYQTERRSAEYITVGPAALGDVPAPSAAQLQSFYDGRKTAYRAPEYRALRVLALDAAALAKPDAVSDADAQAAYERLKGSRFGTPERRTVQQIVFPTQADAEAAAERIKGGTTFDAVAAERNIDAATLTLGTFTKGEMLDPAAADAAFALPDGVVSAPIPGRFGPILVRVTKIEAGSSKAYDEVASDVKREVALERGRADLQTVHDAIEDQRSGGRPLADIAKERGLTLLTIPAVDRQGQDRSGQGVAGLAEATGLLPAVFRSDVGADNEAVATRGGGYAWFEVTGVEGARDRPLPEVRDRVVADWRSDEVARLLAEKTRALAERLGKGEEFAALATELGLTPQSTTEIERGRASGSLPAVAVTRVFATPIGQAADTAGDGDARIVFKVTAATMPPFVTSTQQAATVEDQLRTMLSDDVISEYVAEVQKTLGVQIYAENIRRAIGGEL